MATSYNVLYLDGHNAVAVVTPWVEILVERDSANRRLRDDGQWQEWLYRRIWQALTLQGDESRSFDEFGPSVDDISATEDTESPDPTQSGPQPDESSDSASEPASPSSS